MPLQAFRKGEPPQACCERSERFETSVFEGSQGGAASVRTARRFAPRCFHGIARLAYVLVDEQITRQLADSDTHILGVDKVGCELQRDDGGQDRLRADGAVVVRQPVLQFSTVVLQDERRCVEGGALHRLAEDEFHLSVGEKVETLDRRSCCVGSEGRSLQSNSVVDGSEVVVVHVADEATTDRHEAIINARAEVRQQLDVVQVR